MQIIRAAGDLAADTEVTFWYDGSLTRSYHDKHQRLQHSGFQCTCPICIDEMNTPTSTAQKRESLLGDLQAALTVPSGVQILEKERLLSALEQTYTANSAEVVPRLKLWDAYYHLTRYHVGQDQPEKIIPTTLKALASLGFVIKGTKITVAASPLSSTTTTNTFSFLIEQWGLVLHGVIEVCIYLWQAYAHVAPQLCGPVKQSARTVYKVCFGEDDTFDEHYGYGFTEASSPIIGEN